MRPEPWIEESNYQRRLEAEHKLYLRGCPWCNVCDEQIEENHCYVMDDHNEFETCIHEGCMKEELKKMKRAGINTFVLGTIEDELLDRFWKVTPHEQTYYEED